jgi:hypothetical protein
MSTDIENFYADDVALLATTNGGTTTSLISDEIDHGSATGRGPGPARGLYLVISCSVLAVGPTTAPVFLLEQSPTNSTDGSWSATTLGTYTASTALVPAGEVIAQVALPSITERYSRITASWSTAATAGTVSAYLTTDPQAGYVGRSAVVVDA